MLGFKALDTHWKGNRLETWPISPLYCVQWEHLRLRAKCHEYNLQVGIVHDRDVISEECMCGIHASFSLAGAYPFTAPNRSVFLVRSCGFTEFVHERGFRADEAEIVAVVSDVAIAGDDICNPREGTTSFGHWMSSYNDLVVPVVAERWGLPVLDLGTAQEMIDDDLRMRNMQNGAEAPEPYKTSASAKFVRGLDG